MTERKGDRETDVLRDRETERLTERQKDRQKGLYAAKNTGSCSTVCIMT